MKKRKDIRKLVVLVLIAALAINMAPVAYASENDDFMDLFDSKVKEPKASSVLDEPEEMYVMTNYGTLGYILVSPKNKAATLCDVAEGEIVTVYAKQNGYALAYVKSNGTGGWIDLDVLSEEYYSGPNPSDAAGFEGDGYQKPQRNDYLADYEIKYIITKHGNRAELFNNPNKGTAIAYVADGSKVTVYAERKSYAFIRSESGDMGWVVSDVLKDKQSSDTSETEGIGQSEAETVSNSMLENLTIKGSENECGLPFTPNDYYQSDALVKVKDVIDENVYNLKPLSNALYSGYGSGTYGFKAGNAYYKMEDYLFTEFATVINGIRTVLRIDYEGNYVDNIYFLYDHSIDETTQLNATSGSYTYDKSGFTGIGFSGYGGKQKTSKYNKEIGVEEDNGGFSMSFEESMIYLDMGDGLIQICLEFDEENAEGAVLRYVNINDKENEIVYSVEYDGDWDIWPEMYLSGTINGNECTFNYGAIGTGAVKLYYNYLDENGKESVLLYSVLAFADCGDDWLMCAEAYSADDRNDFIEFDCDGSLY